MIDNKIVAQNHQKIEKCPIFKKRAHFLEKFAQKVFHIQVFYIPYSSFLFSIFEFANVVKIPVARICIA